MICYAVENYSVKNRYMTKLQFTAAYARRNARFCRWNIKNQSLITFMLAQLINKMTVILSASRIFKALRILLFVGTNQYWWACFRRLLETIILNSFKQWLSVYKISSVIKQSPERHSFLQCPKPSLMIALNNAGNRIAGKLQLVKVDISIVLAGSFFLSMTTVPLRSIPTGNIGNILCWNFF